MTENLHEPHTRTMSFLQLLPITVFSLQTGELLLTLAVAFFTGYILKILADKFLFKPKADGAEELENEIEELREKYSAQMFKKEEDVKLLQDEVKAAEKKNLDLKIEYAKAINHIEKLKAGPQGSEEEVLSSTGNIHNEVLLSLKEKIVKQEENIERLQNKLTNAENEQKALQLKYEQQTAALEVYKNNSEKEQNEIAGSVTRLSNEVKEKEELLQEQEQTIESANKTIEQLQQQLSIAQNTGREEADAETYRLKQEIQQLETRLKLADESVGTQAGIDTIRSEAEHITLSIETFKQHLSAALENTYSYEQLLNKNEKLNGVIDQLLTEKQNAENNLQSFKLQLQEEKEGLAEQLRQYDAEIKQTQELLSKTINESKYKEEQLQKQLGLKDKELQDIIHEKNNLQLNLTDSIQKLEEKEKVTKQMIDIVKDFESRILQINPDGNPAKQEPAAVVLEDGSMQYR
jgi:hypothetical protein